jgi:hypothetical protein
MILSIKRAGSWPVKFRVKNSKPYFTAEGAEDTDTCDTVRTDQIMTDAGKIFLKSDSIISFFQ